MSAPDPAGNEQDRSGPGWSGLARSGLLCLIAFALADCAGPQGRASKGGKNYGVAPSPRVVAEGEPVPKGGGRAVTGRPYVVGDRTYVPHEGRGYDREGYASWYGSAFHGRLTANGEVFDREAIVAAHPTLPLPSYARVTNLTNGHSMIVRVNDRGPYEKGRLIDVSERVAEALKFHRKGVTRVRIQYAGKASLKGSDDTKLLATLRTEGGSGPGETARGRAAVASLREEEDEPTAGRAETAPSPRARFARLPEYEEARRPRGGPATAAPAGPALAGPRLPDAARPVDAGSPDPGRGRARIASADPEREEAAPPFDIRPPARPDFARIY